MAKKGADEKIKFVVHPVSTELKRDLRKQGFKIVDASFAPKGADILDPHEKKPAKHSGGSGDKK